MRYVFSILILIGLCAAVLFGNSCSSRNTAEASSRTEVSQVIKPERSGDCAWANASYEGMEVFNKQIMFLEEEAQESEQQSIKLHELRNGRYQLRANYNSASYHFDASVCDRKQNRPPCPDGEDPNSWKCQASKLPACVTGSDSEIPNREECSWDLIPLNRQR